MSMFVFSLFSRGGGGLHIFHGSFFLGGGGGSEQIIIGCKSKHVRAPSQLFSAWSSPKGFMVVGAKN